MVINNNTKLQTNVFKIFFLDLLDAKVSKTSTDEIFLHNISFLIVIIKLLMLSTYFQFRLYCKDFFQLYK